MNYNLQKLEEWYKSISSEKELKLEEAQMLYQKIMTTTNEVTKKELQDEIILGTLHVVYRLLKTSYLPYFPNGMIDVDDVISVASELWIEFVL